jgi:hypothetical protein
MTTSEMAAARTKEKTIAANKQQVVDALKAKFGDPKVVAALAGSIDVETGGTFDYQQKQKKGPARGLFQFETGKYGNGANKHFSQYENWRKGKDLSDSIESQVAYVHDTIYGSNQKYIGAGNAKKIRDGLESSDPAEVTKAFTTNFLRPNPAKAHMDRRVASAASFMSGFKDMAPMPAKPAAAPAKASNARVFKAPTISTGLPAPILGQQDFTVSFPYKR